VGELDAHELKIVMVAGRLRTHDDARPMGGDGRSIHHDSQAVVRPATANRLVVETDWPLDIHGSWGRVRQVLALANCRPEAPMAAIVRFTFFRSAPFPAPSNDVSRAEPGRRS
jgi:hypothetical protein